jgi:hypothetical protein
MVEQVTMFRDEPIKQAGCDSCQHFSELKQPRVRSDEAVIYGYCFKSGDKNHSVGTGKGFAVFQPKGKCEDYKKVSINESKI